MSTPKERKEEEDREEELQETLEEIRGRRQQRYERISTLISSGYAMSTKRKKISRLSASEHPAVCFLCDNVLTGDSEAINCHIDTCLASQKSAKDTITMTTTTMMNTAMEDPFETYTWAGQTHTRAISFLEGGLAASGFQSHHKKDQETDADLDIEKDDTTIYGQPQFMEHHLIRGSQQVAIDEETMQEGGEEEACLALSNNILATSSSVPPLLVTPTALDNSANLLLESLKTKVQQQEHLLKNTPKCMICLGPYVSPLTSIVCWHVYCETCWLKTLGAKKVCPQCVVITAPSDLRRIYL